MSNNALCFCKQVLGHVRAQIVGVRFAGSPLWIWFIVLIASLPYITPSVAQTPVKIGISLPLSGSAKSLGEQFLAGINLAQNRLKLEQKFKYIVTDDGCDRELSSLALDDLVAEKVELITGLLCNTPARIAVEKQNIHKIPLLASGATGIRFQQDRQRFGWKIWQISPNDLAVGNAAFAALSKRWRNIPYAIVDDGTVYGRNIADQFRALMEGADLKPQFLDNFRPSQSTQAGLIKRLKKSGVKAAFVATSADDIATIASNMKEIGPSIEVVTGEAVALLPYLENAPPLPTGLLAILAPQPEQLPGYKDLAKQMAEQKFEPEHNLMLGYATMQILAQKFEKDGLFNNFSDQKFNTVFGEIVFDKDGANQFNPYRLYRWNGKSFEAVNPDSNNDS